MPFPKVPDAEVDEMRKMRAEGKSNAKIAEHFGRNVVTVRAKTKGIHPKDSPLQEPAQSPQQPIVLVPATYQAPVISPSKLEERSPLSGQSDQVRDEVRILRSELELAQLRDTIGQRPSKLEESLAISNALDEKVASQVGPVAEENRKLREQVGILQKSRESGEYAIGIERLRFEQAVGLKGLEIDILKMHEENRIKAAELGKPSPRAEELKLWLEDAPKAVEQITTAFFSGLRKSGVSPGMAVQRTRRMVDAALDEIDPQFGGVILDEPVSVQKVRRRVLSVDRSPRSEGEIEQKLKIMKNFVDEDEEETPRDLHREAELAGEVFRLKRENAELKGRPKVDVEPQPRRVISVKEGVANEQ